jgi:tetratricopeptide (TPR) repeat protein
VENELFTVDAGHLVADEGTPASGRNEATRELCRAYLDSGIRLLGKRNMELALEHTEEGIRLARDNDDRLGEEAGLGRLGNILYRWDELEQALDCYEQALHIARQTGGKRAEGYLLFNIGLAQDALSKRAQAIPHVHAALRVLEEIDDIGAAHVRARLQQWEREAI